MLTVAAAELTGVAKMVVRARTVVLSQALASNANMELGVLYILERERVICQCPIGI